MVRNQNRKPYKVKPEVLARLKALREAGKSYRLCGELLGLGKTTAFKHLRQCR